MDGRRGRHLAIGWLVALVAASSGCKWLPVRHPERDRKAGAAASTADRGEVDLPPLPEMHSIGDDEAFKPAEPTPLLNAAASRDAAIKRAFALTITSEPDPATTPPRIEIPPRPQATPVEVATPEPIKADPLIEPAAFSPPGPQDAAAPGIADAPPAIPDTAAPEGSLWDYVLSAMAVASQSPTGDEPAAGATPPPAKPEPEFVISDLRVCQRVLGFGRTEGLASEVVVAGKTVLLYCELEGVRDEEVADGVRSRLGSTVAIVPESGGDPVWSFDLGIAEDHCRRRRRDFFVNYRVKIPESLAPGAYRVRLVQSDLLAGRTASRSVPLVVRSK